MKRARLHHKTGFTLTEILISLVLILLGLSILSGMLSYVSDLATTQKVEETLESVVISKVEEYNFALHSSGSLKADKTFETGNIGDIKYSLSTNIASLVYPGAYSLKFTVTSDTGASISREVILYAAY